MTKEAIGFRFPKLQSAFKELNKAKGMFARLNHSCCQGCGISEVPKGNDYAFMHEQDMEGLNEDGHSFIAFGSDSGESKDTLAVGKKVVKVLKKYGIRTRWNGSIGTRIRVDV